MRRGTLSLLAALVAAAAGAAEPAVEYHDDRVTLRAADVPRADVVAALAHATGAELRGQVADPAPVTVTLDGVPLNDALHRLLGTQSFTVTYGTGGRVKTIALRGGPQDAAAGIAAGAAVIAASSEWQTDERLQRAAATLGGVAQREVPVNGRLAKAVGTRTPTFERLAQAALVDQDPRVRARALRAALATLEQDPELRDALAVTVTVLPPDVLVKFTREMASDGSEEFAARVARFARTSEVRRQATEVQRRLREPE